MPSSRTVSYTHLTQKGTPGFDLKKFVLDNFDLPVNPAEAYKSNMSEDIVTHIKNLWTVLTVSYTHLDVYKRQL